MLHEDYIDRNPEKTKNLEEEIIEHFGLDAEQYLECPSNGLPEGGKLALGLYTNGWFYSLNKALRENKNLGEGEVLIHRGLNSAFDRLTHNNKVIKTYRGTRGRDAFHNVSEGSSATDAGYLSTSRKLKVAESFGGATDGVISVIFGRSGIDASHVSIEGEDESEILYNKNTEMTVLFSGEDNSGITRRVMHESGLSPESGTQEILISALDLQKLRFNDRNILQARGVGW